jgi:protein-S-isoprenylcysteine O-methyltransferase Ste14
MYLAVVFVFAGGALACESLLLLASAGLFFAVIHLFVTLYEEPTLGRSFGEEYDTYRREVGRWWPRLRGGA